MTRWLTAATLVSALSVSSVARASSIVESSLDSSFGNTGQMLSLTPGVTGIAWNGFMLGLGSATPEGGSGLYVSVQSLPGGTSDRVYFRAVGTSLAGGANGGGRGVSSPTHVFGVTFEHFGGSRGSSPGSSFVPVAFRSDEGQLGSDRGSDRGKGTSGGNEGSFANTAALNAAALNGTTFPGGSALLSSSANTSANLTTAPEPASLLLFGSGLAGAAAAARRRRARARAK